LVFPVNVNWPVISVVREHQQLPLNPYYVVGVPWNLYGRIVLFHRETPTTASKRFL
jgi:hypothetical protein